MWAKAKKFLAQFAVQFGKEWNFLSNEVSQF